MTNFQQKPILSAPNAGDQYRFPGTTFHHRVKSSETNGVFSVIELVTEPGQGVATHVHQHEDELVYILDGELEVTLGDQKMKAGPGIMALLPRGIPHGFTNVGKRPSRLLVVILPGKLDNYFVELGKLYTAGEPSSDKLDKLAQEYGVKYV
ncbi:MAG: cupin domain-containing protein [Thermodesulfobacteriota bacterium]